MTDGVCISAETGSFIVYFVGCLIASGFWYLIGRADGRKAERREKERTHG
jgi:membrane protein DedA with SNARE-associated domain